MATVNVRNHDFQRELPADSVVAVADGPVPAVPPKGRLTTLAAPLLFAAIAGIDGLGTSIAFAALIFTGPLAAGFGMGTFIGLTIYLPIYFQGVMGLNAASSGLGLLPLTVGTVVGATLSGRAMTRLKHYKRVPVVGLSVALAGVALLAWQAGRMPLVPFCALLALISVGLGTMLPVATVSIQNAVLPHQLGTATGAANFFRQIGGALIVAVFGAIVLGGIGSAGPGLSHESIRLDGVDRETMVRLFQYVFGATCLGFACALGFLLRMEELPLRSGVAQAAKAPAGD